MTDRQKQAAMERYEEGLDLVKEIAQDYGVNEESIRRLAKKRGIKRFKWSNVAGHRRRKS